MELAGLAGRGGGGTDASVPFHLHDFDAFCDCGAGVVDYVDHCLVEVLELISSHLYRRVWVAP